ncbi:MAG: alpha-glucosidase [Spirochaetes bacterium GWD1_27_9]|nr:MAG: alpha-glucosidase [Spirochaetes bacterium GWB1_27_13]OHD28247.1 MAG: alpha-glucosidase [Spirochaetes bacterium GWC1_27_15]OHD40567.1 MAG: alpha-glucosidase [Spirochaetes bacterium GWD1_27_9]
MKKGKLLNFTSIFRFGYPFHTNATLIKLEESNLMKTNTVKFFDVEIGDKSEIILTYKLNKKDIVYGLGENLGGLNKRGKKYRLFANDDPLHTPEKEALYGSHPFLIIDGKKSFGFFIDYPSEILFDIGFTDFDTLKITILKAEFDLYIFDSENKKDIIKEYLQLTGTPYIPPKWAFGFQQSRWSYYDSKAVQEVANSFRKKDIPCDAIYLDIDYMDSYKVFTVDDKKFPDFTNLVSQLKEDGFKLIPIIDPGVKVEEGYDIYEEGKDKGYFCKKQDGTDFIGTVWPGQTNFPDFINPEVRKWWGNLYKKIVDCGVEGFWNDMNEPAIFFTPDGLSGFKEEYEKIKDNPNVGFDFFKIKDKVLGISNRGEDYKNFYHNANGKKICHYDLHNLYGFNMCLATSEGFKTFQPNKRYFLLSRSSYAGLHRFCAIWMGDNQSWWEHMLGHIKMLISLNMCGFFYTGADVGGFGGNSSPEMVIRWMQLGAFTPLYRNHSALGTRQQEPYAFDSDTEDIIRNIIKFRYALIPYIYSEFMRSVIELSPFISALAFNFSDDTSKNIEDQFMFGSSLMVCPIYTPNTRGRFVYLPDVKWLKWNVSKYDERKFKVFNKGSYFIDTKLDEIPVFLKENTLILMGKPSNYVGEKETKELSVIGFVTDRASFSYYDDDGISNSYNDGKFSTINIIVEKKDDKYKIHAKVEETDNFKTKIKKLKFEIYDDKGNIFIKSIDLK